MKIVFADVDGVLNNMSWIHKNDRAPKESQLSPSHVARLTDLVRETGAKVVVSSTWRILHKRKDLQRMLESRGFVGEVIGRTSRGHNGMRGLQIAEWLTHHPEVHEWVVLDDEISDMDNLPRYRIVKTEYVFGLLDSHVERAVEILNRDLSCEE